jgi:hypothetical protein
MLDEKIGKLLEIRYVNPLTSNQQAIFPFKGCSFNDQTPSTLHLKVVVGWLVPRLFGMPPATSLNLSKGSDMI